ncbi:hypothetical protein [Halomarina oriensis]|uniref:Uncharacterized protein n=1 Tax=Halomarina oriensis TaxID=671145 RepID=A0A6B0GU40_9EURY|nr:hypothetical protein [Halomarina oriensis]MWG36897.1 hypothetical protein [Halomarina oriensis]
MARSLVRRTRWLVLVVGVVALVVAAVLVAAGATLGQALAGSLLLALFTFVVVPLVVIARRVGSVADDPLALERRLGTAAGRSQSELDALSDWDERRGRLDAGPDDE